MKTTKSLLRILTITTALAAGCSKSDTPAENSKEATSQASAPLQKTGDLADKNIDGATKQELAMEQEAGNLAAKCAKAYWTIQEDGTLWFGHVNHDHDGQIQNLLFLDFIANDVEFKPVTPYLVTEEISEADRLNGVTWKCAFNFSAPAARVQRRDKSWTDWKTYRYGTFWSVSLEKRNENWTVKERVIQVAGEPGPYGEPLNSIINVNPGTTE